MLDDSAAYISKSKEELRQASLALAKAVRNNLWHRFILTNMNSIRRAAASSWNLRPCQSKMLTLPLESMKLYACSFLTLTLT